MTDRLTTMLHDEAATFDIPAAPVDLVLADGRAIRRRRRTAGAVIGAAAAVAVVAAGVAALVAVGSDKTPEPAKLPDQAAYEQHGAWARGDEVHVGNHTATVRGAQDLHYTSAGVVVTTQDGYVLVTPAGDVEPVDLGVEVNPSTIGMGTFHQIATDATAPYLAYVRVGDDSTAQAVVLDLSTGEEHLADTPFRSDQGAGYVTSLWGDLLTYERGGTLRTVDWHTGKQSPGETTGWFHQAGVDIDFNNEVGTWTLRSVRGETLLTVASPYPASSFGSLSPDGHYFAVSGLDPEITVYDIGTGDSVTIEDRVASGYGWTPDGHLVGKRFPTGRSQVETCDPTTGSCEGTGVDVSGKMTLMEGLPGLVS